VDSLTTFDQEWSRFLKANQAWSQNCYLFWMTPDAQMASGLKVIRRQCSSLCYLLAPSVLQHYHVCLHTKATDHLMVDVCAYVRNNLQKGAM
jgi:hypothetical protein